MSLQPRFPYSAYPIVLCFFFVQIRRGSAFRAFLVLAVARCIACPLLGNSSYSLASVPRPRFVRCGRCWAVVAVGCFASACTTARGSSCTPLLCPQVAMLVLRTFSLACSAPNACICASSASPCLGHFRPHGHLLWPPSLSVSVLPCLACSASACSSAPSALLGVGHFRPHRHLWWPVRLPALRSSALCVFTIILLLLCPHALPHSVSLLCIATPGGIHAVLCRAEPAQLCRAEPVERAVSRARKSHEISHSKPVSLRAGASG